MKNEPMKHQYTLMRQVNDDVMRERHRQNAKWGLQRHEDGTWALILVEEVGEYAQACQAAKGWGKPTDAQNKYEELIHIAAVASAAAEQEREELEANGHVFK
jgi:NTP pyrophosphatase (non-canonical NTP hydrolase)